MALACYILCKFLGVGCHSFPPPLSVPNFIARFLHVCNDATDPSSETMSGNCAEMKTSTPFRDLLHAANGTDGFTSPPKEGVLRIFSTLKIQWLRPGLNPRSWILKASMLPLDHRSCLYFTTSQKYYMFLLFGASS
jgi:hypothetical protein